MHWRDPWAGGRLEVGPAQLALATESGGVLWGGAAGSGPECRSVHVCLEAAAGASCSSEGVGLQDAGMQGHRDSTSRPHRLELQGAHWQSRDSGHAAVPPPTLLSSS